MKISKTVVSLDVLDVLDVWRLNFIDKIQKINYRNLWKLEDTIQQEYYFHSKSVILSTGNYFGVACLQINNEECGKGCASSRLLVFFESVYKYSRTYVTITWEHYCLFEQWGGRCPGCGRWRGKFPPLPPRPPGWRWHLPLHRGPTSSWCCPGTAGLCPMAPLEVRNCYSYFRCILIIC